MQKQTTKIWNQSLSAQSHHSDFIKNKSFHHLHRFRMKKSSFWKVYVGLFHTAGGVLFSFPTPQLNVISEIRNVDKNKLTEYIARKMETWKRNYTKWAGAFFPIISRRLEWDTRAGKKVFLFLLGPFPCLRLAVIQKKEQLACIEHSSIVTNDWA